MSTPQATGTGTGPATAVASPPAISSVSPAAGSPGGGTLVTLTGSNFTQATAVRFGPALASSFTVVSATQITAVAPPGSGTVLITVTTPGGTSNGVAYSYTATPVPSLTGASPVQGPTSGGTTVTLTGTNLLGAVAVRFGPALASSFTVVSATQITAVAPPGSGTVQITVVTPGGTSNGVAFTYVTGPVLSAVSPGQGPVGGANSVTLTGSGLTGVTAVTFGSVPASSFTVVSATQINAVAPPGTAGPVQITVTGPGGTSNGVTYFYVGVPSLTGASPVQGPTSGGTTVTLTGTNFLGAAAVRFGAVSASSFTVVSATQITAVAPPGSGTVQITVVTPGGTSNGVPYAYVAVPVLTGLSPTGGPLTAGTTVTLFGSGLTTTSSVLFGATPAPFTVVSDSWVTATAPSGPAGPVNVRVTTPGGTSNSVVYTRVAAPGI
ncbi:IPT/TIG domain-containing protein [Streptomyces luomodiensis]|uniref:IPT/TIG domain-containing protein n=1 Tax=Streptomyces luomodiensis TaxID=3026192 RepID=A0ABY9V0M6_9ACTN|nr:IPT/TIG domain-containing protein [Streptomyces sp. SCA4-21]WNE98318.1 IPT/TIG domain-containing protein [Streptomyces sp. SCA4-21]